MDERGFENYLRTDGRTCVMDASPIDWETDSMVQQSLAYHDHRYHPNGYVAGQACAFRRRLAGGDLSDTSLEVLMSEAEAEEANDLADRLLAPVKAKAKRPALELQDLTADQLNDMRVAMKAYNKTFRKVDHSGRAHAQVGGEYGLNDQWYEGGRFLPEDYTVPSIRLTKPHVSYVAPETQGRAERGYSIIWDKLKGKAYCPYEKDSATGEVKVDRARAGLTESEKYRLEMAKSSVACNHGINPDIVSDDESVRAEAWKRFYEQHAEFPNPRWHTPEFEAEVAERVSAALDYEVARAKARRAVDMHLLAMWKQGHDYVSDLYMAALHKSALAKYDILPEKKMKYHFKFVTRQGREKESESFSISPERFDPKRLLAAYEREYAERQRTNVRLIPHGEFYHSAMYDAMPALVWENLPEIPLMEDQTDGNEVRKQVEAARVAANKAADGGTFPTGKFEVKDAVCVGTGYEEGRWGDVYKYKFKTPDGKLLFWKTSKELDIDEGDTLDMSGMCKGSSEFKGTTYNFVSRCGIANLRKAGK